jgi:hypothetical protein
VLWVQILFLVGVCINLFSCLETHVLLEKNHALLPFFCATQPPSFQLRPSLRLFRARPFGPSPGQFQAYPDNLATHGPARSRGRWRSIPDPRDVFPCPPPRYNRGIQAAVELTCKHHKAFRKQEQYLITIRKTNYK